MLVVQLPVIGVASIFSAEHTVPAVVFGTVRCAAAHNSARACPAGAGVARPARAARGGGDGAARGTGLCAADPCCRGRRALDRHYCAVERAV